MEIENNRLLHLSIATFIRGLAYKVYKKLRALEREPN
jgi:hypothetical protein